MFQLNVLLMDNVQHLTLDVLDELKVLSIFTNVFDCFFRFVADILDQQNDYSERDFWQQVADCVISYQQSHPELKISLLSTTYLVLILHCRV